MSVFRSRFRAIARCSAVTLGVSLLAAAGARAEDVYKIGMSAGLTGYAATVDTAWRDGVEVAIDRTQWQRRRNTGPRPAGSSLSSRTTVPSRKKQSPAYRKMISSDNVNVFASGCVSAGNFAAAPLVVRAETPMVLCSILPQQPDQ